jgi:dihydrodipicolinate synthase/N-acetylneuraminate lyase
MIPKFNAASHIPLLSDRVSLDWEKVAREVMWLEDEGAESLVISIPAGTPYLTNDTIVEYVEAACEARRSLAVICDVGARRTEDAVALASEAEDAGADYIMVCAPYMFPLKEQSLFNYYATIAGATGREIVVYNLPRYTNNPLSTDLIVKMIENIPNVGAVKETITSIDEFKQVFEVIHAAKDDITLVIGDDQMIWDAFCVAEDIGTISTACSMFPTLVRTMRERANAHDENGRQLQDTLTAYKQEVIRSLDYLVGQQATAHALRETGGYNPLPMASPTERDIAYAHDVLVKYALLEGTP